MTANEFEEGNEKEQETLPEHLGNSSSICLELKISGIC